MANPIPIEGTVHPKFERVREAFEQNFDAVYAGL